jgi:hypothetical protein
VAQLFAKTFCWMLVKVGSTVTVGSVLLLGRR